LIVRKPTETPSFHMGHSPGFAKTLYEKQVSNAKRYNEYCYLTYNMMLYRVITKPNGVPWQTRKAKFLLLYVIEYCYNVEHDVVGFIVCLEGSNAVYLT
jgi:hypothetical protein